MTMVFDLDEVGLFWLHRRSATLPGAEKLMSAMIESAVRDIRGPRSAIQPQGHLRSVRFHQRAEAIAWVYSDDTTWSHSFLNCCETLGWWPPLVRELVQREIESTEQSVRGDLGAYPCQGVPTGAK